MRFAVPLLISATAWLLAGRAAAAPASDLSLQDRSFHGHGHWNASSHCYPGLGFHAPLPRSFLPDSNKDWWCDPSDEYGFLGFSYDITACQPFEQLLFEFQDARHHFRSRYIRLYGACDNHRYYDQIIEAAYLSGLGVHALIWFGFDGNQTLWRERRDALYDILQTNPLAPFVTRVVQFGSEPLFDDAIPIDVLKQELIDGRERFKELGIPFTISELAYGYQSTKANGSYDLLNYVDSINIHQLPYFAPNASTGAHAWPNVLDDLSFFLENGGGKKLYFDENGWPSEHYCPAVCPNSPDAVSSIASEREYYELLDAHCEDLKAVRGGGVGWFWHIYSDSQDLGYGLYDVNGTQKFHFSPRTSC